MVQTYHVARGSAPTVGSLTQLCEDLKSWLNTASHTFRMALPSTITIDRITAYDLHPGSHIAGEAFVGLAGQGSSSTSAHQVALVATWLTANRGRSFRGRTYWGPIASSWISANGLVDTAQRESVRNALSSLYAQLAILGHPMGVASFERQVLTPIIGIRVDNSPDVQRRRQRRSTQFSQSFFAP